MSGPNFARLKGTGDFDAPTEAESEPGPIWGDMAEIETALKDYSYFADECAEIMADYLTGPRDSYAQAKMARQMLALSDRCEAHINALEEEA